MCVKELRVKKLRVKDDKLCVARAYGKVVCVKELCEMELRATKLRA